MLDFENPLSTVFVVTYVLRISLFRDSDESVGKFTDGLLGRLFDTFLGEGGRDIQFSSHYWFAIGIIFSVNFNS
jgi:hypothetical protein